MATTRREIQEQEPVVEDVPIYTEEEQLAPEEFINPFGPDEFNYRRALSDGYNLSEINQFLAAEQGFDIEQAYRDGYNDEEIVEFLSGGKIARSAAPILRGAAEGAVEEGLGAYGLVKGATSGFKTGLKFPGPPPVKLIAGGIGAAGGALTYAIAGQSLGELLTDLFTGGSDVLPSQRSAYEGGRTAGGTLATMITAPYMAVEDKSRTSAHAMRQQAQKS